MKGTAHFLTDSAIRLAELMKQTNRQTILLPTLDVKIVCRIVDVRAMTDAALLPILRFDPAESSPEEAEASAAKIMAAGRDLLIAVSDIPRILPASKVRGPGQISIDEVSDADIEAFLDQAVPVLANRVYRVNPMAFDFDAELSAILRQDEVLQTYDALGARYGKLPHEIRALEMEDLAFDIAALQAAVKDAEENPEGKPKKKKGRRPE